MAKKLNINSNPVYSALDTATAPAPEREPIEGATAQEAAQRQADMKTQGRKGCKASRINMAFSTDNYEYLRIMAGVTGQTITAFCNSIIDQHRAENPETFERAKAVKKSVYGGKQ